MLTILHPEQLLYIREIPIGILPICVDTEEYPRLVIKVPKEYILAAKINAIVQIYLVPIVIDERQTLGIILAFFDDEDEPLIITVPLCLDEFSEELFKTLQSKVIYVHFFDELSREHLVYLAKVLVPDQAKLKLDSTEFLDFSPSRCQSMLNKINNWFRLRTSKDDAEAIQIVLDECIFDSIPILDLNHKLYSYHGSRGFGHTVYEREEPGSYQEEDIIRCLLFIFSPEQIYLNPKRTSDREEVCDVLVITQTEVLIIQAKDSPNIERISRQKLSRKRKNVLSAFKKAIKQMEGAVRYYRRTDDTFDFYINNELHSIKTKGLELKTLVVVKEFFIDQNNQYSQILLDFVKNKEIDCLALDYPKLYQLCVHLQDEKAFFNAYNSVMTYAVQHGNYPQILM